MGRIAREKSAKSEVEEVRMLGTQQQMYGIMDTQYSDFALAAKGQQGPVISRNSDWIMGRSEYLYARPSGIAKQILGPRPLPVKQVLANSILHMIMWRIDVIWLWSL